MTRRIDELLAECKRLRAEAQSRGILSDPGRLDSQLIKVVDEMGFVIQGQFEEIDRLNAKIRSLEKKLPKK